MNFRKIIGLNSSSRNQTQTNPVPVIYGSIFPLELKDGKYDIHTVKQLSFYDVKGNNLFFECIEHIMQLSDSSFNSGTFRTKVDACLKNNGYNYENAKNKLFAEIPTLFKTRSISLSDNPERLLYLEILDHTFFSVIDSNIQLSENIKRKSAEYLVKNNNDYNKAKKSLLFDLEKYIKQANQ